MSGRSKQDRLVHVLAVVTAVVSLAPIGLGSLVTTLGAGMAFPDWPTSDGQGMLAYPWLQSSGDKFVEHGHRLAGMLVGFCSIGLCAVAWFGGSSRGVRYAVVAVLAFCPGGGGGGLVGNMAHQVLTLDSTQASCALSWKSLGSASPRPTVWAPSAPGSSPPRPCQTQEGSQFRWVCRSY